MLLVTCVLLSFINHAILEDGNVHTSSRISCEEKLHNHLKLNYPDVEEIPGSIPRNTSISVRFLLKTFKFHNDDQKFEIYVWMYVTWHDALLKWNPADFDGIDSTYLTFMIQFPDIKMDNDISRRKDWKYFINYCRVSSSGSTHCMAHAKHTVLCQTKLTNWPQDVQTCIFNYTSQQSLDEEILGLSTIGAEYGTGWNIIESNYTLDASKKKITLTFVVERLAHNLATMYVIPLIVIVILNFTAMTIDFESKYRIYILCFCLLSHFMFMQEINSIILLNGYETPKILIFLRASLVISAVSIVVTFALKNVIRKSSSPPLFVLKFNKLFLDGSRKVFIVWSKWMVDSAEISTESTKGNWLAFANILNYLNISVYCIVYPVLFLIYIPRALPSDE